MQVIPAIDLMGERCVRLVKGQRQRMISYPDNPLELAERYGRNGAEILHVIDLDGAFTGKMLNMQIIEQLAKRFAIQVGGGIRNEETIGRLLDAGVKRVIVSTLLIKQPRLAKRLKEKYYGRLVGSFDFKNGGLSYAGWTKQGKARFEELADGLETIIVTDTSRDGSFEGPNLEFLGLMRRKTDAKIIAAGGIRNVADLLNAEKTGMDGAIVGRALLEKRISLRNLFGGFR